MIPSLFGRKSGAAAPVQVQQMAPAALQQWLNSGEPLTVIDVRSAGEYQMAHVPGSRLLPLPTVMQRGGELPADRPVVCVCRSGARSQVACEMLARQGFSNVINLQGGMIAWERAGLPTRTLS